MILHAAQAIGHFIYPFYGNWYLWIEVISCDCPLSDSLIYPMLTSLVKTDSCFFSHFENIEHPPTSPHWARSGDISWNFGKLSSVAEDMAISSWSCETAVRLGFSWFLLDSSLVRPEVSLSAQDVTKNCFSTGEYLWPESGGFIYQAYA